VPNSAQDAIEDWVDDAVRRSWPEARLERLFALKGDASMRRFWRAAIRSGPGAVAPDSAIAVDLGPDDLPLYARVLDLVPEPLGEPPFVNVHRLMERLGVAVPALYRIAPGERRILVEDVGELSLYEAVRADPAQASPLYRLALDELVKLHTGGTANPDPGCIAYSIAYDRRLFRWEMEQFIEYGIPAVAPGAGTAGLSPELDQLAAGLDALPRVLSHRDYHYQNLFIQKRDGTLRIRVIDFQDALMAPAAQDLAVLLTTRDTGALITPALEAELLDYYFDAMARRGAIMLDHAALMRSYRWCVLQHALKVIGRFVYLEEQSGKTGYKAYLPATVAQARRILESDGDDFPRLREVLCES
jgi:aminoglycoside/choline kinase family phosphotransferase